VPLIQPSLSSNNKIVGGTEAVKNGWPWQVLISDGRSMCGASLINSQVKWTFYFYLLSFSRSIN